MGVGQSADEVGGFRVFKVTPGGPAAEAGLEVFFDFIAEIAGERVDSDQNSFFKRIADNENRKTLLKVYNIRTHAHREVVVTPRRWGGAGLLGAVVRYDALDSAENQGIRVLDVFPNSPAEHAGLVPLKDYLLGTTEVMFRDLEELIEIVNLCVGRKLQIWVYNSDTEVIREVAITPNTGWGGEGAIGADIRTGLLHRIPPPRRLRPQQPDEPSGTTAASMAAALSRNSADALATVRPEEEAPSAPAAAASDALPSIHTAASPPVSHRAEEHQAVGSDFVIGTVVNGASPQEAVVHPAPSYVEGADAAKVPSSPPVAPLTKAEDDEGLGMYPTP